MRGTGMGIADDQLWKMLRLPDSNSPWLYLNPERIDNFFTMKIGSITEFSIDESRSEVGSVEAKLVVGARGELGRSEGTSIRYEVDSPLVKALLLRAYVEGEEQLKDIANAQPGDFTCLVAEGDVSHPTFPSGETGGKAGPLQDVLSRVEEIRVEQEQGARFVNSSATLVSVGFATESRAVASVIDLQWMSQIWMPSYRRGGYLGIFGVVEPSPDDLLLVAPFHIWWQAES
jgi:hypothetical protein